ncbi:hypothetical protein B0A55_07007 [Friedmanniomyces simplex]|uniref:3-isopropylmalate dehydratase n=1 Tax=Friedmanniomyces simplex TaxID=329884 RepID=A0A4U0X1R3_9PEZI|nr:hypothetical protein B0A55_07007 [Friedmanniomyces simplex]
MAAAAALKGKLADVRKLSDYEQALPNSKNPPQHIETPHVEDPESDADLDNILDLNENSQGNSVKTSAPSSSAGMPKFTQLKGIAAPLEQSNIDTDAIIPKQFLKTIKRAGLSKGLFHAWRWNPDGSVKEDFILNKEPYTKAKILVVTGPNFGCGSSREHAPWALLDFGITCILAPSFGDIFFNNTLKNGMLPQVIEDTAALRKITEEASAGREIEVDLEAQNVKDAKGHVLAEFKTDDFRRNCLINGLDDIGLTMQKEEMITKFEGRRTEETPWLDGSGFLSRHRKGAVKVDAAPVPKTNQGEEVQEPLECTMRSFAFAGALLAGLSHALPQDGGCVTVTDEVIVPTSTATYTTTDVTTIHATTAEDQGTFTLVTRESSTETLLTVTSTVPACTAGYGLEYASDVPGSGAAYSTTTSDASSCCQLCADTASCAASTWDIRTGVCKLEFPVDFSTGALNCGEGALVYYDAGPDHPMAPGTGLFVAQLCGNVEYGSAQPDDGT